MAGQHRKARPRHRKAHPKRLWVGAGAAALVVVVAGTGTAAPLPSGEEPGMPSASPSSTPTPMPSADPLVPTLVGRAFLSATAYQSGPPAGAFVAGGNGVTPPFPGQPLPGFSALVDAGDGNFWGLPDNGFTQRAASSDFLLRIYRIQPEFRGPDGGAGTVMVKGFLQLSDPDGHIPFPLARPDRVLTGADLDPESLRLLPDGSFWIGDEYGPYLVHVDPNGRVLSPPVSLPGATSPENPQLPDANAATLPRSRGFEALALAPNGYQLYVMLEGALRGEGDPRRRVLRQLDVRTGQFTALSWNYAVDAEFPGAMVADLTAVGDQRFVLIERDNGQGAEARHKKIYLIDLREYDAQGYVRKELIVDLLQISDPAGISMPARPGEFGVGPVFSYPLVSVESLEVLSDNRLLIANDNNFPNNDGRWVNRDRPDDIELIVVHAPALGRR